MCFIAHDYELLLMYEEGINNMEVISNNNENGLRRWSLGL